jgi:hypothetical protein
MKRIDLASIDGHLRGIIRHTLLAKLACALLPLALLAVATPIARAETCTTQSALAPGERDRLADATRSLAAKVQANDATTLRTAAVPELAKDFGAMQYLVAVTAPKLAGGAPVVEQVYLLDATNLKHGADGSNPEGQFFCSLNRSTMEAEFDIPALPPGKYAFAMVTIAPAATRSAPWRLSFLMRQEAAGQPQWLLAGFYPKPLTAAGHDGLWYWTQARQMVREKQPWNAWLYYQAAQKLLQPADFVLSTHLDKLRTEAAAATPPALSDGIGVDAPLVVKAAGGAEYRFTALSLEDSPGQSAPDVAAHLRVEPLPDQATARKRNDAAASALLAAYPELRKPFHGISVYAEAPGQNPLVTEQPMAEIK